MEKIELEKAESEYIKFLLWENLSQVEHQVRRLSADNDSFYKEAANQYDFVLNIIRKMPI